MLEVQNHSRYEFFRINTAGAVEFIFNPYIMSSISNYINTYIHLSMWGHSSAVFKIFFSSNTLSHLSGR